MSDLNQFGLYLIAMNKKVVLPDMNEFASEFNKLYSQQAIPSRLQIMTIHKSKGLEFDTVFLPGLGAQPNRGDSPMLRWLKITNPKSRKSLTSLPYSGSTSGCVVLYMTI